MILTFSHALFGIWSSKLCGNAHDLFDYSYSSFHSLHTDVFEWTVETVTACAKIRARKSHKA